MDSSRTFDGRERWYNTGAAGAGRSKNAVARRPCHGLAKMEKELFVFCKMCTLSIKHERQEDAKRIRRGSSFICLGTTLGFQAPCL